MAKKKAARPKAENSTSGPRWKRRVPVAVTSIEAAVHNLTEVTYQLRALLASRSRNYGDIDNVEVDGGDIGVSASSALIGWCRKLQSAYESAAVEAGKKIDMNYTADVPPANAN